MRDDVQDDVAAVFGTHLPKPPTVAQQNWSALISIVIIVLMVIVGAFYVWGKRIAERDAVNPAYVEETSLPADY